MKVQSIPWRDRAFITTCHRNCGKIMFSVVSVSLFVQGGRFICDHRWTCSNLYNWGHLPGHSPTHTGTPGPGTPGTCLHLFTWTSPYRDTSSPTPITPSDRLEIGWLAFDWKDFLLALPSYFLNSTTDLLCVRVSGLKQHKMRCVAHQEVSVFHLHLLPTWNQIHRSSLLFLLDSITPGIKNIGRSK